MIKRILKHIHQKPKAYRDRIALGIASTFTLILFGFFIHNAPSLNSVVTQGPTRPSWKDPSVRIPIKHRCQFSWFCDGKSDNPKQVIPYNNMLEFARMILSGEVSFLDITDGALFYHADYVRPSWARTKKRTIEIEDHIFYRLK